MLQENPANRPSTNPALVNLCELYGVSICDKDSIQKAMFGTGKYPIVSLWCESEIPTNEELQQLKKLEAERKLKHFVPSMLDGNLVKGPYTMIFKRSLSLWQYTRVNIADGRITLEWSGEPSPLNLLASRLIK